MFMLQLCLISSYYTRCYKMQFYIKFYIDIGEIILYLQANPYPLKNQEY